MYKYILPIVAIIIAICALYIYLQDDIVEPVEPIISADLAIDKCPVCEVCGKITASKIISDNPDIDLTKYNNVTKFKLPDKEGMEIQIGDKVYTKEKYNPDTLVLDEEILKQK